MGFLNSSSSNTVLPTIQDVLKKVYQQALHETQQWGQLVNTPHGRKISSTFQATLDNFVHFLNGMFSFSNSEGYCHLLHYLSVYIWQHYCSVLTGLECNTFLLHDICWLPVLETLGQKLSGWKVRKPAGTVLSKSVHCGHGAPWPLTCTRTSTQFGANRSISFWSPSGSPRPSCWLFF